MDITRGNLTVVLFGASGLGKPIMAEKIQQLLHDEGFIGIDIIVERKPDLDKIPHSNCVTITTGNSSI